ncbi:MFS transporter [Alkalicoccus halolimnae]|uniref:MFS transporter n=1 Tax=Alkalicoccus halolimnae TaxID=1667239 RepID=A0A5C7F210_9BACI|nr:MFS transporter [Alkalicoccus halolimnae]TXF83909.1 MFS transporter [Alkalicoccus halolimnae]
MSKFIYLIILIVFLDTFIQLPIITPFALSLGASAALAGAIVSMYSLSNIAGNIIGGVWIDRAGRKHVFFFGIPMVIGIVLLYPLVENGYQLLFVRFLHGLAGGLLVPAAFALIGDRAAGNRKVMAYAGAAIGLSAITGPAIGGILAAQGNYSSVYFLVAALFAGCFLLVYFFVPAGKSVKQKSANGNFSALLKNKQIIQACLTAFALMVSNGTLAFALPLKTEELGLTSASTGILLSIYGITALVIFLPPQNKVYEHFQPFSLVLSGLLFLALSMLLLSTAGIQTAVYAAMVVYGIGFAFIFPSMNQLIASASKDSDRGRAYGLFYACFSLGVVAGSAGSGLIAQTIGMPFLTIAVFTVASFFALRISR